MHSRIPFGFLAAVAGIAGYGVAHGAASSGSVAFNGPLTVIQQSAGVVKLGVLRAGGTSGAATVKYQTVAGTAVANADFTAESGALTWADGDAATKWISVPLGKASTLVTVRSFSVVLSGATGATIGALSAEKVAINPASAIGLSSDAYSAPQTAATVQMPVKRVGNTSGAAAVHYQTADGSASAGSNFVSTGGTLRWAPGDASSKTVSIPLMSGATFTGNKTFTLALSTPTGASLGTPSTATATITGAAPPSPGPGGTLSVRVQGNHLIDAQGNPLQLRGVNVSGLEFTAVQGWDPADPFGGQAPNWNAIKVWKANVVRLPLNEASWLGRRCADPSTGAMRSADPGNNYVATVSKQVSAATAAGFYVILDLHISAPGSYCPMVQIAMADAENSVAFWTSVAQTFKSQPNVMFELFNEPFPTQDGHFSAAGNDTVGWEYLELGFGGASFSGFNNVAYHWQGASMQSLLNAVRGTGATNVVLASGLYYAAALDNWLVDRPVDPLHQLAAAWHAYPTFGAPYGSAAAAQPNFAPQIFSQALDILNAGYPILITETGERCSAGTTSAPELANLSAWADAHEVSLLGWTWDTWASPGATSCSAVLIQDSSGTPTPGYGVAFRNWLVNHH